MITMKSSTTGGSVDMADDYFACSNSTKLDTLPPTSRHAIIETKDKQNHEDFQTVLRKGDAKRRAMSVQDVVDCRRLPILRTRLISKKETPRTATKVDDLTALSGSATCSYTRDTTSMIVDAKEKFVYKIDRIKPRVIVENESENDRLARVLKYMSDAREIIDSSRLLFEAAVNFDEMEMFERACFCYQKCTSRVNAALVVDTYDLPADEKYQRKVKYQSKFQLKSFLEKRSNLRNKLIWAEEERQRLRERAAHCNLSRIYLLTEMLDFTKGHTSLCAAFGCCSNQEEHEELLWHFHALLKDFSDTRRKELPLSKQVLRSTEGPLCDAHVLILHDLQNLFPNNTDVQEWLAFRYAEKNDFESSQQHFQKYRQLLEPEHDMAHTLELWRSYFDPTAGLGGGVDGSGEAVVAGGAAAEKERALQQAIIDNVSKKLTRSFDSYGVTYDASDPRHAYLKEEDKPRVHTEDIRQKQLAWFAGKHEDSCSILYKVPPLGWNTTQSEIMKEKIAARAKPSPVKIDSPAPSSSKRTGFNSSGVQIKRDRGNVITSGSVTVASQSQSRSNRASRDRANSIFTNDSKLSQYSSRSRQQQS